MPRLILIEHVELCNALAEKILQHHTALIKTMTGLPNGIQAAHRGGNNIASVLRWRVQFDAGRITVIGLVSFGFFPVSVASSSLSYREAYYGESRLKLCAATQILA